MTELEQKLLTENEALKRENEKLQRELTEKGNCLVKEVESIDEKHVKFNGQVFHQNRDGHFVRTVSLHEAVWRFYFGDIPKGYVIHHRNGIKSDNRIENLQMMTEAEHRAWHNQHSKIIVNCSYCGKKIRKSISANTSKLHFCSKKCCWRYKNENGIYHEEQTCVICGKKFLAYKYSKTNNCSKECRYKLISLTKQNKLQT